MSAVGVEASNGGTVTLGDGYNVSVSGPNAVGLRCDERSTIIANGVRVQVSDGRSTPNLSLPSWPMAMAGIACALVIWFFWK